jgi:death-on-curing protein
VTLDFLTVVDVLGMHKVMIHRYGGVHGVRDLGALEAALFRPQTGYYQDIVAHAAALMESLAIIHPFIDGNKRVAFAAADVFFRINGWYLDRSSERIHNEMIHLFKENCFQFDKLDPWLREFARPKL